MVRVKGHVLHRLQHAVPARQRRVVLVRVGGKVRVGVGVRVGVRVRVRVRVSVSNPDAAGGRAHDARDALVDPPG